MVLVSAHRWNKTDSLRPSPKRTIADVLAVFQNPSMERFVVLRQVLTFKTKRSAAAKPRFGDRPSIAHDADERPGSRLAGLLVLFVPLAGVAWLAIGWLIYRLVT
jgi:hypothetical protein